MTTALPDSHSTTPATEPLALKSNLVLGPLPTQREGQYLAMTICGTSDDPAERGHWSSPAHVQWRINKAVAADRERWAGVEEYLVAAADGSMSRNNSENLAAELLAQVRGPNSANEAGP